MPREIPKTLLRGISVMLRPYIGNVTDTQIEIAVETCRSEEITLGNLCKYTGLSKPTMRQRLAGAGVEAVRMGGRTGREMVYSRDDALAVVKQEIQP